MNSAEDVFDIAGVEDVFMRRVEDCFKQYGLKYLPLDRMALRQL